MEQNENTLSVLKIAPGQYPQQVEIDNDLKALQQAVGGSIGASYPFEDPVAIVYNDDGKLMGLPLNRALWDEDGLMYDVIAGTFLVVGLGEEDFVSLSPELAQKYEEEFHQPEAFLPLRRRLMVIPVPDESVQNDAEIRGALSSAGNFYAPGPSNAGAARSGRKCADGNGKSKAPGGARTMRRYSCRGGGINAGGS